MVFLLPNGKHFTGAERNRQLPLCDFLSQSELYPFFFGGFAREAKLAA
jgi:hypothetical protein